MSSNALASITRSSSHPRVAVAPVLICALALLVFPRSSGAQACVDPSIRGFRWCQTDIPYYLGPGLTGNDPWKLAIIAVVAELNAEAAVDLAQPLFLSYAGSWDPTQAPNPGINFHVPSDVADITCGVEDDIAATRTLFEAQPPPPAPAQDLLNAYSSVIIINSHAADAGYDRKTIVRHELMHALGVGHSSDGSCLMSPHLGCGQIEFLDFTATDPLICLYGDNFGSGCTTNFGLMLESEDENHDATYTFFVGNCSCLGGGCLPGPNAKNAASAALSYEFAISESGGPYTAFATVSELSNGRYTHTFTQSYNSGMVRLRVLDGATLVDEAFLISPIHVQVTTGTPSAPDGATSLRIRAAPNPFRTATVLSLRLPMAGHTRVDVYDVVGRRVAELFDGELSAGEHPLEWNGLRSGNASAASGVYRVVVRVNGEATASTLIELR